MKRIKQTWRIRTKLIGIFALFTLLALCALMLFQGLFLDGFYQSIKIAGMKKAVREVTVTIETDGEIPTVSEWSLSEDIAMYVFDETGELLDGSDILGNPRAPLMNEQLQKVYQTAQSGDGTFFSRRQQEINIFEKPEKYEKQKPGSNHYGKFPKVPKAPKINDIVLYGELVGDASDGSGRMVLALTNVTPVDAVTRMLTVQSTIASLVIVALSVVLAVVLAKRIASPIEALNNAAKGLSDGTYVSPPQHAGYLEAVQLQQTMDQVALELQKSEQLQRELIANVSHDLRTPLTMITGYGEAIRDLPGEDVAENIQVVIDEANRLTLLVNDLLDLSKLKAGQQTLDMMPLNMTEFMQDVVERFRRMREVHDCRLELQATSAVWVQADEMRLSQAVYNLIGNAMYHCGDDRVVCIEQTVTDTAVRVSFSDHGEGIPETELANIWERYYQVRRGDSCSSLSTNSGLGLSIVKSVVELHGGTCGVSSAIGKGSTFWFELPRI